MGRAIAVNELLPCGTYRAWTFDEGEGSLSCPATYLDGASEPHGL